MCRPLRLQKSTRYWGATRSTGGLNQSIETIVVEWISVISFLWFPAVLYLLLRLNYKSIFLYVFPNAFSGTKWAWSPPRGRVYLFLKKKFSAAVLEVSHTWAHNGVQRHRLRKGDGRWMGGEGGGACGAGWMVFPCLNPTLWAFEGNPFQLLHTARGATRLQHDART